MKKKYYTYQMSCSFQMQYTFSQDELVKASEGDENDFEPSDGSLINLQNEMREYLSQKWSVSDVEVDAEFDSLLGVIEGNERI